MDYGKFKSPSKNIIPLYILQIVNNYVSVNW